MEVLTTAKWSHEVHHLEVISQVSLFSSRSTQTLLVAKTSKNRLFNCHAPPFVYCCFQLTHVRVGLKMEITGFSSGRYSTGDSIEYDNEKEVSSESIAVLSWKGHF